MKNSKGFTLIELLVAIVLVGILSAIAIPNWQQFRRNMQLREAARTIAGAMRLTRAMAVDNGREHRIYFNMPTRRYRIITGLQANNSPATHWSGVDAMPLAQQQLFIVRNWTPLIAGTPGANINFATGANCDSVANVFMEFNPNGTANINYVCVMDGATRAWRVGVQNANSGRILIEH